MSWVVVHVGYGNAHVLVGQCRKPTATSAGNVSQVQAQRLDEHHVGELLRNQRTAGLWVAKFLAHALKRPAHGGFVRLAADVDDGRQRMQEHLGVAAGKPEETSGDITRAFLDLRDVIGLAQQARCERVVDWLQGEIGGEPERKSTRQNKAVSDIEQDWI